MHPPINVLIKFNDFIKKNIKLQNIKLKGLLKNVIPITYQNQTPLKHSNI